MECLQFLDRNVIKLLEKHNLLKSLIKSELKSNAIDSVQIDENTVKTLTQNFINLKKLSDENGLENWLNDNSMSKEIFMKNLLLPHKIKKHCTDNYYHQINSHFLSRKSDLDKIIYSLIRVKDFYLAKELYLRLQSNEESFANLSRKYSEGIEKERLGIVGPVLLNQSHPALANVLKKSFPGEVNEPFQVNGFWLIVRVESFIEAILDTKMESDMMIELFDLSIEEETMSIIKDLNTSKEQQNNLSLTT